MTPRPIPIRTRRRGGAALAVLALASLLLLHSSSPAGAAGSPGLERMLGWVTSNNDYDDEFRADLVIRVPAGESPTLVRYDADLNGSLDTVAALASGAGIGQEYQIINRTNVGADDLLVITIRGDAVYDATCATQPLVRDNHVAITMPSGVIDVTGFSTSIYRSTPCAGTTRPGVRLPWDNAWGSPDGSSQDGWGLVTTGGNVPANKVILDADNVNNAYPADCGITDSVTYQWYLESSPGIFTPVGSATTAAVTPHTNNTALKIELGAQTLPGPGYYKMLAWPSAESSSGGASCTTRTFTPGNVDDAYTVATVFNDLVPVQGAPMAHPVAVGLVAVAGFGGIAALLVRRRATATPA